MKELPITPDFEVWPITHNPDRVVFTKEVLSIIWSDKVVSRYHALMLRENSPEPNTTHPKAREMSLLPSAIDTNLEIHSANIESNGAVAIGFSDGSVHSYHPGWLRGVAWFDGDTHLNPILWDKKDMLEPPTFSGPNMLKDDKVFLKWLEALRDYGMARLRDLPNQDGLLEEIVTRIGPIRETNFGRHYILEIKDLPDSQAFTSEMLPQHMDIPTRETPHGLQFLYIRKNTTVGGEGTYIDGYKIAQDMLIEEPEHYYSLVTDIWEYNNRSRKSDYRGWGPVIEARPDGSISSIRYNTFLRAPLKASAYIQGRAYKAYQAFCRRAQDSRYLMSLQYEAGDLFAFDNRRVLHGRSQYDNKQGERFIEGTYADRDDLYSRISILKRQSMREALGI